MRLLISNYYIHTSWPTQSEVISKPNNTGSQEVTQGKEDYSHGVTGCIPV